MSTFQTHVRTAVRGTAKLAAFAAALFVIVIAFQIPVLGVALAAVLWGIVVKGQLWRF